MSKIYRATIYIDDKNGKKIFEWDIVKYSNEETKYTVMFDPTGYWCLDGNGVRNSEMLCYPDIFKYLEAIDSIHDKVNSFEQC